MIDKKELEYRPTFYNSIQYYLAIAILFALVIFAILLSAPALFISNWAVVQVCTLPIVVILAIPFMLAIYMMHKSRQSYSKGLQSIKSIYDKLSASDRKNTYLQKYFTLSFRFTFAAEHYRVFIFTKEAVQIYEMDRSGMNEKNFKKSQIKELILTSSKVLRQLVFIFVDTENEEEKILSNSDQFRDFEAVEKTVRALYADKIAVKKEIV